MPVIAMTREIGSHGTDIAAEVASQLGIAIINAEIVSGSASGSLGVEQGAIQRFVDGSASILERWRIDKKNCRGSLPRKSYASVRRAMC
jgi:hypothetical protein